MTTYNGYEVYPQAIRLRASAFTSHGKALEDARSRLKTTLAAAGSPWGDDHFGKQFEKGYLPLMEAVLQRLDEVSKAFYEIRTGLDLVATRYEEVERQSTIGP
ncbi:hypothetical protein ACIBF6_21210 [Streptosporangium amethystogenes]|uniref:hypothetical protein n=1 Tax=Streptosporangium amethystogenes TaxID=2002 RepID=UPI0037A70866